MALRALELRDRTRSKKVGACGFGSSLCGWVKSFAMPKRIHVSMRSCWDEVGVARWVNSETLRPETFDLLLAGAGSESAQRK